MTEPSWVGRTLNGRYKIEELLGQGGMASVYRATDPNLRRVVAIKLIHSHLSNNPDFVRRFEAEASAVARLRHHNIIQVYDFNHDGSTYYIVFEFISGESLQGWLRRLNNEYRKLPVADVVRVAAAVADALDYAHQQELIHRDVKPANVMINMRGEPILMDFGIAKIVGSGQHTATGTIIGTARYMSPEQIKGIQVDARTDVYSLGVVLFEMLSGQAPYESDSAMTLMMMHIQDPVPNVLNLRPDVPPGLALVVQRALAKDPQQRYTTAAEMAAALRSAMNSPALIAPGAPSAPALTISLPADPPPGAAVQSAQPAPASVVAAPPTATSASGKRLWAIIGIAVAALLLLPLLIFGAITLAGRTTGPATPGIAAGATSIAPTAATEANLSGQSTPVPATEVAPTAIAEPTAEPTIDARPTATPLPEISITNVALVGDVYVVQYTVVGFEESLEGMHIHFFFNTTPPREAGRPFSDFFMYAGRSPYAELRLADTPAEATQLCALVANPDHTIQGESGNCFDLPVAPEVSTLPSPTVAAASGGSGGSYVVNTPTSVALAVRISEIRVDNGVYQVEYTTSGFTEQLPGVHIHFFFDVVAPENAGLPHGGPWYVWGGPRPFNGYQVTDKPAGAKQMCALVANPDHTVQPASGNCVNLPDVAP